MSSKNWQEPHFSAEEIVKITGVPMPSLKAYLRFDFICPSIPSGSRGKKNLYSFKDAILVKMLLDITEPEVVSRKLIQAVALASEAATIAAEDPFSLGFSPRPGVKVKSHGDFPQVFLEIFIFPNFCRVGLKYPEHPNKTFDYDLIRLGKQGRKPKIISKSDLSPAELDVEDKSNWERPFVFEFNLTKIHFEVRTKVAQIGKI